jgi:hypothetical protein
LASPQLNDGEDDGIEGNIFKTEPLHSMLGACRLVAYDEIGISIRYLDQDGLDQDEQVPPTFVPWGAVLQLDVLTEPEAEEPCQG